jgi:hypothetical protein
MVNAQTRLAGMTQTNFWEPVIMGTNIILKIFVTVTMVRATVIATGNIF